MIYFKGDEVKLKSGELAEVLDTWGVARTWHKLKSSNGNIIFAMSENIEMIVKRQVDKKGKGWKAK
ncbi:hypothetical protein BVG16_15820 [Paenibacillus selenitireducens]|uniref:Uncharacterized protein n=1 Tax=Paenibacillus selenitireducens TaxID=1324314 RepID=A0A1T2XAC3_9BACL|nr:hypothetical protein BVG16_15820 [Paenibacillus selenitireducens]